MMIQALDRLFAILLVVILLFVIPTYYRYQRQEEMNYQLILLETQKTADLICELGYVDEKSLTKLYAVLGASGASYRVGLTHMQKKFTETDGEMVSYYIGSYNHEIQAKIKSDGKYVMDLGDFFYINVENTSKTPFQQVRALFGIKEGEAIITRSGGLIRAEGL